ncbi:MAG TPA: RagB/SusD family nutrient uptake outer membrane protein [Gemmatimonadaceae bacterium]|nr:RagB/SusD family nutrient uptake outer membrane protein [Gemmatimonadaceae bacterium]
MTLYRFSSATVRAVMAGVFGVGLLTACNSNDLLKVQSPSRIPASGLYVPGNATLLVNSAIADFECAFGAYAAVGGLIGDELADATQTADRYPYDQRTLTSKDARYQSSSCESIGVYSPLQTARISADKIRQQLVQWSDQQVSARQLLIATANAYEGYAELLLGEGFCNTVFSTVNPDGSVSYGDPITPAQAFDSAITRFNDAVTAAQAAGASGADILNLAYVGRARAALDKGDLPAARADAAKVPASFRFDMTADVTPGRRYNRVWAQNGLASGGSYNEAASVDTAYHSLNDPRVPVKSTGDTSRTKIPIWVQTKFPTADAHIRIASGDEAQLIIAEADLAANPSNSLAIINTFRARSGGSELPLLPTATAAQLKSALIEERRREFFLEGQRLYDLIRFQIEPSPPAGANFPGGGTYGSQLCMPLPDVERFNNPKIGASG